MRLESAVEYPANARKRLSVAWPEPQGCDGSGRNESFCGMPHNHKKTRVPIMQFLVLLAVAVAQQENGRAAERIKQAQYCAMVTARAQHREVERVQPASHLTEGEARANRKAELDKLVPPAALGGNQ